MDAQDRGVAEIWSGGQGFGFASLDYALLAPQRPIMPWREPKPPTGRRWVQQTRRRALILATARRLVAEEGYANFAVRRLAQQSSVTPPTIYNLIGRRTEVLHRAVVEAHAAKVAFANARAAAEDLNPVLAYVDTLWMSLSREPSYSRQVIHAIAHPSLDRELGSCVRAVGETAILGWLNQLQAAGRLQRSADLSLVAELANRQITVAVQGWARGELSLAELRRHLAAGMALMLLGLASRTEAARIEPWLG